MKWWKIILPVVLYLITVTSGMIYHHGRHVKIAEIYAESRETGLPVIVTYNTRRQHYKFKLHSFEGDSVFLNQEQGFSGSSGMYQVDDSTFYYTEYCPSDMTYSVKKFNILEDKEETASTYDHFRPMRRDERIGTNRLTPTPWLLVGRESGMYLENVVTGESTRMKFSEGTPWDNMSDTWIRPSSVSYDIRRNSLMTYVHDNRTIWRYSIDEDTWVEEYVLGQDEEDYRFGSKMDNLALVTYRPPTQAGSPRVHHEVFIRRDTGEEVFRIENSHVIASGARWVLSLTTPGRRQPRQRSGNGPNVFRLFDMEDDWKEYNFEVKERSGFYYSLYPGWYGILIEPDGE